VNISVWDAETNVDLPGAIVTMNGTNYSTPFSKIFVSGRVLKMLAFAPGYMDENKTVIVKYTPLYGNSEQSITFLLSANLVRH